MPTSTLQGLEPLYGGMVGVLRAVKEAVPPSLESRFGVGPGRFPAALVAWRAEPGQVLVAPADMRELLSPLPVEQLPVARDIIQRLQRLGLHTFGDVGRQQISALQAHFWPDGQPAEVEEAGFCAWAEAADAPGAV